MCSSLAHTCLARSADVHNTNLAFFHNYVTNVNLALDMGSFAKVKAIHGSVLHCRWSQEGSKDHHVVLKRLQIANCDTNTSKDRIVCVAQRGDIKMLDSDDAFNEIGIYALLMMQPESSPHILRMHGCVLENNHVWLVIEYADGGDFFDFVQARHCRCEPLEEAEIKFWFLQLVHAVHFIHARGVASRDISLENIVKVGDTLKLMDFGQGVQTHSSFGIAFRYKRAAGKILYRPPECFVPDREVIEIMVPPQFCTGGALQVMWDGYLPEVMLPRSALPSHPCQATVWGYEAVPADMFQVGICLFVMCSGMNPWRCATLSDECFRFVHGHPDDGVFRLLAQLPARPMSDEAIQLLSSLLWGDPRQRPTMQLVIASSWLE